MSEYYLLNVKNLSPIEAEIVSALVFEAGAGGTEEILAFEQKNREYEPVTIPKDKIDLKVYFSEMPNPQFLENLKIQFPQIRIELSSEQSRDWLAEWKKGFVPFELATGIWLVPSWCPPPPAAKKIIRIDPGMAFGTGTHETTQLAAGFINDFAENCQGQSLLDVGTGTAILAILAELKGFSSIVGNDIDSEARRVARENVEINSSQKVQIVDEDIAKIKNEFNWVVANIIDGVLVKIQATLKSHVKKNGFLLLTGILAEREKIFIDEFLFSGFRCVERRQKGEWLGFLLEKVGPE